MKVFKKVLAMAISFLMVFAFASCSDQTSQIPNESTLTSSVDIFSAVSEYPSSSSEISSHDGSGDLSSVISKIESSQRSSKPASSKPVSSVPVSSTPNPVSHEKMKAVWISYLEFDSFKGSSENAFRSGIQQYLNTVVAKGLNTVIVQVRPHGDSMYPSKFYPWSKHASGTVGVAVNYDPLAIMVEEAHSRNLEIHAWINPYRTMTDSEFAYVDSNYLTKQWYTSANRSDYMVQTSDGRWWLKPGNKDVQKLIIDGSNEIVQNYQVDGIHIDDYFYNANPSVYGDTVAQAKANTTALVKGLRSGMKVINANARFGVSPAGGFRENNALPNSDMGDLCTDLATWCTQPGYIDYVMPQIYWDYNHSTQPFTMTLKKWESFVTADSVALYIGLAPYRLSNEVVHQQIKDIMESEYSDGYCLFRYEHIVGL